MKILSIFFCILILSVGCKSLEEQQHDAYLYHKSLNLKERQDDYKTRLKLESLIIKKPFAANRLKTATPAKESIASKIKHLEAEILKQHPTLKLRIICKGGIGKKFVCSDGHGAIY